MPKPSESGFAHLLVILIIIAGVGAGILYYSSIQSQIDKWSSGIVQNVSSRLFGASQSLKPATPSSSAGNSSRVQKRSALTGQPRQQTAASGGVVYYKGKVLNIVEDKERYRYTVTLQPQDDKGNNNGSVTVFTLPEYPPKTNSVTLGKDIKEMVDKGFNPISIVVTYGKDNRFVSWESLK